MKHQINEKFKFQHLLSISHVFAVCKISFEIGNNEIYYKLIENKFS